MYIVASHTPYLHEQLESILLHQLYDILELWLRAFLCGKNEFQIELLSHEYRTDPMVVYLKWAIPQCGWM